MQLAKPESEEILGASNAEDKKITTSISRIIPKHPKSVLGGTDTGSHNH
jgi:hypothetical protein